jgi:hypothetical protein
MSASVTQHTLTPMRSIAALGLGLGITGRHRSVCSSVFIIVIIITEAVEVVAVGRSWFVQAH